MDAQLLYLLSLAAHGRAFLRRTGRRPLALPAAVDVPPHAQSIVFQQVYDDHGQLGLDPVAQGGAAWLQLLQRTGHTALDIACQPHDPTGADQPLQDWRTAGMVGGGSRWLIGATSPAGRDLWEAALVRLPPAPAQGDGDPARRAIEGDAAPAPWTVQVARVERGGGPAQPGPSLGVARQALVAALAAIRSVAQQHGLQQDAEIFGNAQATLLGQGPAPADVFHGAPLPAAARRLADAAQQAWVFGGMLSWNDCPLPADAQAQHAQVTQRLYTAVCQALAAAANSAAAPPWWRRVLG